MSRLLFCILFFSTSFLISYAQETVNSTKTCLFLAGNYANAQSEVEKNGGHITLKSQGNVFVAVVPQSFNPQNSQYVTQTTTGLNEADTEFVKLWNSIDFNKLASSPTKNWSEIYESQQNTTSFRMLGSSNTSNTFLGGQVYPGVVLVSGQGTLAFSTADITAIQQTVLAELNSLAAFEPLAKLTF